MDVELGCERYALSPAVFDVLEETAPGKGGEVQPTHAL